MKTIRKYAIIWCTTTSYDDEPTFDTCGLLFDTYSDAMDYLIKEEIEAIRSDLESDEEGYEVEVTTYDQDDSYAATIEVFKDNERIENIDYKISGVKYYEKGEEDSAC